MAFLHQVMMNALAIVAAVALFTPTCAKDILVGDEYGWTLNFNYQAWGDEKEFHVGDRLIFNYTKGGHNVIKVDGVGFQECSKPEGVVPLTSGNDVIPLVAPGKKWYICGVANHCASGLKLVINVSPNNDLGSPTSAPSPSPVPGSAAVAHAEMAPTFFALIAAALGLALMMI